MFLITNQVAELRAVATRDKRMLRMPTIQEAEIEYEVSDVSAVPHPSQINS